jgi:fused signal recognition particle receptor
MFGLLKSKLSNFIKGLSGKEEGKGTAQAAADAPEEAKPIPPEPQLENSKQIQKEPRPEEKTIAPPPTASPIFQEEEKQEKILPQPLPEAKQEHKAPAAARFEGEHKEIKREKSDGQIKKAAEDETQSDGPQAGVEKTHPPPLQKETRKEEKKSLFASVASVFSKKEETAGKKKEELGVEKQSGAKETQPAQSLPKKEPEEAALLPTSLKDGEKEIQRTKAIFKKEAPSAPSASKKEPKETQVPASLKKEPSEIQPQHSSLKKETLIPHGPATQTMEERDLSQLEKKAYSERREMAPKISIGASIKSFFTNEITIGEGEVSGLISDLELSLLEADVAYDVSLEVTAQLRGRLVGMKVPKGEVEKRTRQAIGEVLESVMDSDKKFDFIQKVKSCGKPVKILFVGPNGAGKTTTIAKIGRMLMDEGMTVVLSASDTFRAAAIEQTEVHAARLGVKVIKSKYGSDPSSVAFDAISFARSHSIDVVLIDSAGRQDTNANLLSELKKINRVASPHLKIYVGESIGGNSLLEQIRAFNEAIGIDGAVLTKLDCDAKGGTAISISKSTGIPVLFLGVGQRYEDLVVFDPHRIAQEIMS